MLLGVDVGGTFTDAAVFDGEALHTAKAPTTPGDEARGVEAAVEAALATAGRPAEAVARFVHGMTVATNALLTEGGAETWLVTTEGFADALDIARQDRPALYRPCAPKPTPLVPPARRVEVAERMGPQGVVRPLDRHEVERVVALLAGRGARSVAICLLFAHLDPSHEARLAAALRERLPEAHVSASHEVLPRPREYERFSTTVIDAYLSPLLGRYLGRLADAAEQRGLPAPEIMQSSGGLAPWREAATQGARSVLSGPAGGAVGAALVAQHAAGGSAIGLDMGGTSCDVCVVEDGAVRRTNERRIGGRAIQLPMVDVHTVGAGGGSVAWRDHGGAMRVGPRSAGAEPGPACYGRGGTEPTVTDANLALGRLAAGSPLAGGVELDEGAARAAVRTLAAKLGLGELEAAEGIVRLANTEMVRALRVVTVERGVDPRRFALVAFGGAGPMHAAALAAELGMRTVLCPRAGGVLSALGLLASARRRDTVRSLGIPVTRMEAGALAAAVAELAGELREGMPREARIEATYELRYEGQSFELAVPGPAEPDPAELVEAFEREHERRYGFRDPEGRPELVAIAVSAIAEAARPAPRAAEPGQLAEGARPVRFAGRWHEALVLRGEPAAGTRLAGPAVLELPETTMVLPPGWRARVDEHGTVVAEAE